MSGRRMAGTSRPSLAVQVLALFYFISQGRSLFQNVSENAWKSQTFFRQTSATGLVNARDMIQDVLKSHTHMDIELSESSCICSISLSDLKVPEM